MPRLACGADGGVARALRATAQFLLPQGRIKALQDDYSPFVTPAYAEAAMAADHED